VPEPVCYRAPIAAGARRVTRLQHQAILFTGTAVRSGHFQELEHRIVMRPDEESRSGRLTDFKWPSLRIWPGNGSRSDAKGIIVGVHDRQFEPSNRSFEIDREATVCTASRRFLPLCGREAARTRGTSLVGRCLFGSLSALGLGCSLIPGARWLCRRRMLRCLGLPRFTGVSSTRNSDGREWGLRTYSVMQALSQRN
jgi:hypothetical protein